MFNQTRAAIMPASGMVSSPRNEYDVFVSYSRKDGSAAKSLVAELEKNNLKVFFDVQAIDRGVAWQQKIFETLDACERVVALYSPEYVRSKVCQEEFNIAWTRSREESTNVLFPIFWASTHLPTYMKMLNYVDCRECRGSELENAAKQLSIAIGTIHLAR